MSDEPKTAVQTAATAIEGPGGARDRTTVDELPPVSLDKASLDPLAERYEVRSEIGRGGMGEVRLSFDRRIGRTVAVKRALAGSASSDRFFREICVQGQLEHPAIVPLYDVMFDATGDPAFTMKRVRGRTLTDVLNALSKGDPATCDAFSQHALLSAFARICLGIAFAHSRHVVHRDLKPDNLMLGEFGEVYILDWGVARILGSDEAASEERMIAPGDGSTREGSVIGTLGYMSPEQCRGEITTLDGRADVYSLGAILFEILTLSRLHPGGRAERTQSTLDGVEARPSVRAPERDVPPELEAACVKATRVDPRDRHATVRDLHDAIESHLSQDRDLGLRRTMAEHHAVTAAEATERATTSDADQSERRLGLAEAGRALALDPTNATARRALVRLLVEPPRVLPPEALEEIYAAHREQRRAGSRFGIAAALMMPLLLPPMLAMGVHHALPIVVHFVFVALFGLANAYMLRLDRPGDGKLLLVAVLAACSFAALAPMFGPFLVVPTFSLMILVVLLLYLERHHWVMGFISAIPMVFPLFLQGLGVLAPTYVFEPRGLVVLPQVLDFSDARATTVLLFLMNAIPLAISGMMVSHQRRLLVRAEEKVVVQAWQLKQLLPAEEALAGGAISSR